MFEKELKEKLTKIFELKHVRFESPGESQEQETLFIDIENVKPRIRDGKQTSRVAGRCTVFAQGEKMPFGYFAQKIAQHPDLAKDFFFEPEENARGFMNINARSFRFQYFFNSQYDPAIGIINEVTTTVEVIP